VKFRLTQRGLTISMIVLTAVVIVIGVAVAATSSATFCRQCKSHEPIVASYKKAAHSDVNCELCHSKPGPFFFLTAKLEALQQPIAQFTGDYEEPILASVLNQSCRQCHTNDDLFTVITARGIRVQHEHLIEAGFLCIRCHSTVGHPDAVPEGSRTVPSMDQCLMCHNNEYTSSDGKVAKADCGLCHTQKNYDDAPTSHAETTWIDNHGSIGILSTCSACHKKPDSCSSCHNGIEMPHADSWLSRHGRRTDQVGVKACGQCHDTKTYCGTCHQVKMPHPADYVVRHPGAAERVGQTCFNCHEVGNCQACHDAHASGDPRAHDLFKAQKYTPTPTPTPATSL
jgi:nitrate/TMAO reductase-like tetraheme cytochrome c subunit